ncbi:MAG: FAD-dependent oxidoreductase [Pseudomonadota bacterium]
MTRPSASVRVQAQFEAPVHTPALVIGAGACGMTAALALAARGVECVVVERDARPSGSTALSSGFIPAAGTAVQRGLGIDDSAADFARDIQAKAHGSAAPHLVEAYTGAIAPALDFLQQRHGLQWEVLDGFLYPGHTRRRMHSLKERTGSALAESLEAACQVQGIPILTHAQAQTLVVNEAGSVLGVEVQRPDGSIEAIACDALLLACNGYGASPELLQRFVPEVASAEFAGHPGNDGTALRWGEALGAPLADMQAYQGHGSWAQPHGVLITWALMMEGGVQINTQGQRFHDETQGYSEAALHVLAQPGRVAWNVFDERILELARSFPDFAAAEAAGALKTAADVTALARIIGCDAAALEATLASAGQGAAHQAPDAFARHFKRALAAPYYAIKVTGALFHTQGGLDIDGHCRVLRAAGNPTDTQNVLPNLWAAGGAARGVSGNHVSGYLSGNGLLSAVAGGYIAAGSMADQLGTPS